MNTGRTRSSATAMLTLIAITALVLLTPHGAGGQETEEHLIPVNTAAQLNAIRWDLDGNGTPDDGTLPEDKKAYQEAFAEPDCQNEQTCNGYQLTNDIDLPTEYGNGEGWDPIGGNYKAVFEGNGHTITKLFINRPDDSQVGLFATIGIGTEDDEDDEDTEDIRGEVRNLSLPDVDVTGKTHVGGLAGSVSKSGNISNSHATGSVSGRCMVGGLTGSNHGGITTSFADVTVTATPHPTNCLVIDWHTGGLVGKNDGSITASYARGNVSSTRKNKKVHAGGLVGVNDEKGNIKASYSTGTISINGGNANKGGLTALNNGTVTHSYWDTEVSGEATSADGEGKTTAELQNPTDYDGIYKNWNVDINEDDVNDDPWYFGTTEEYPEFNTQPTFGTEKITDEVYKADKKIEPLQLPEATGGNGTLTYTLEPDPPTGLTFDADARTITGTPTEPSSTQAHTYTATDADGDTTTLTFSMEVKKKDTGRIEGTNNCPEEISHDPDVPTTLRDTLQAIPKNGEVTLTWRTDSPAAHYVYYRQEGKDWEVVRKGVADNEHADEDPEEDRLQYTVKKLKNGRKHRFVVCGKGLEKERQPGEAEATPCTAEPENLDAKPGKGKVTLTWTGCSGATHEIKYRRAGKGNAFEEPVLVTYESELFSHAVENLESGKKYIFRVRMEGAKGKSARTTATPE